jgi:hypothetical protein
MNHRSRRAFSLGQGLAALLLLLAPTAGVAEVPIGPSQSDTGQPGDRRAAGASLFISPVGQPFRAAPGEPYPVGRWFAQVDRNGDGRIDLAEFRADAEVFFHALDTNRDGVVDGFELSNYEHNVVPEILGAYFSSGAPGASPPRRPHPPAGLQGGRRRGRGGLDSDADVGDVVMGGAAAYELLSLPEPVASADADLTGRVSLSDFLNAANRRFALLDTKGQGYLALAELPMTPVQRAAAAAAGRVKGRRGS